MLLPLGDAPNPRDASPWVTYALIAANCAVYVLVALPLGWQPPDPADPALAEYLRVVGEQLPPGVGPAELLRHTSAYDLFVFRHGFRPVAPALAALVTSMFLHAGFLHLFGNMLFLWIYGDNVEHRLGRGRFLVGYLATGVLATVSHAALDSSSPLPMIGASGAVSGVLGFYFVFFPRNSVRLLVALFPLFVNVVEVPARLVLLTYVLIDNLLPFLLTRGLASGGVAYAAHIGGFIGGGAAAWLMDRREWYGRPPEYRAAASRSPATVGEVPSTPGGAVVRAIEAGEFATAAQAYFALAPARTRGLLQPDAALALARWLRAGGHPEAAVVVLRRQLREEPDGPLSAEAHVTIGEIQWDALDQPALAYQHFLAALRLPADSRIHARARAALAAMTERQKLRFRRGS